MRDLFLSFIGILILSACSQQNDMGEQLAFDTLSIEKKVVLDSTPDNPECKINISVHYMKGSDSRAKAVNDAIERKLFDMEGVAMELAADSFANRYLRDYTETVAPLYKEDKANPERRTWYGYHYNITTETQGKRKDVTTYIINTEYYEGGEHGINQQLVMNFDAKSGRVLSLKDVFVPGYENRLKETLLGALEKKLDAKGMTELHDLDYLRYTEIFAPENFILGSNDITFIYNVYEIAPYAKGKTELVIPYEEIDDLLKKQ